MRHKTTQKSKQRDTMNQCENTCENGNKATDLLCRSRWFKSNSRLWKRPPNAQRIAIGVGRHGHIKLTGMSRCRGESNSRMARRTQSDTHYALGSSSLLLLTGFHFKTITNESTRCAIFWVTIRQVSGEYVNSSQNL